MIHEKLVEQLRRHEGERLFAYQCSVGMWTIGVGRAIGEGGKGITESESTFLLLNDIAECTTDLQRLFGDQWNWISDNRKIALVDHRFNLGPSRFRSFRRMIAAIKREDWPDAGKELLDSRWATQVQKSRVETIHRQLVEG